MEEQILVKSEHYNLKKCIRIVLIVFAVLILLGFVLYACNFNNCRFHEWYNGHISHYSITGNMLDPFSLEAGFFIDIGLIVIVLAMVVRWWFSSYDLTVTDKRIYGKTTFGKRVDLPVDSISAVGTSVLKGIAIATASGKIVFKLIKNRDEIHSEISNLIISRQSKSNYVTETVEESRGVTDELKKFKELLDCGAITQEEYDKKKKELLNI